MELSIDPSIAAKYEEAKRVLRETWRPGTTAWLREHSIGTLLIIEIVDQHLNDAWNRGQVGACTEAEFDLVLEKWRSAHAHAIELFKTSEER